MGKASYCIVIDDSIVRELDKIAYKTGMSRSSLINVYLAEKLGLNTSRMRIRDTFSAVRDFVDSKFVMAEKTSEYTLAMKSLLNYKYNPSVRYTVELNEETSNSLGVLRVHFRTRSANLKDCIDEFFRMWQQVETAFLSNYTDIPIKSSITNGRYIREFRSPESSDLSSEEMGNAIGMYINLLDTCMQQYFDNIDDMMLAEKLTENTYRAYLNSAYHFYKRKNDR